MKISENGINLIKEFEGMRLTAYKCPAGVWTIGIGHTGKVDGKPICSGMTITKEKAIELLKKDLSRFEKCVEKYNDIYNWTQNEFDALVSFAYNVGSINQLTASGTRNKTMIANSILLYNKAGGKELTGLTRRRKAEQALFLKSSSSTNYKVLSNLNCRDYPSTGGNILGVFKKGTVVKYISKKNTWIKVKGKATSGETITGYCSSKYLRKKV